MRFQATPNLGVVVTNPNLAAGEPPMLRFDKNGFYETKNPFLVRRLKRKFKAVQDEPAPDNPSTPQLVCSKCGAAGFVNNGYLLAHTRKFHPKGAT